MASKEMDRIISVIRTSISVKAFELMWSFKGHLLNRFDLEIAKAIPMR